MEDSSRLADYLAGSRVVGWVAAVLSAATVALLAIGLTVGLTDSRSQAAQFLANQSTVGQYCYIDVRAVSPKIYQNGANLFSSHSYYLAQDTKLRNVVVAIKDSDFAAMTAQREYWRLSGDAVPEAYRLYGTAGQLAGQKMASDMAGYLGLSAEGFDAIYGAGYLDATATPQSESTCGWLTGAAFVAICALIAGIGWFSRHQTRKASLARLAALDQIEVAVGQMEGIGNQSLDGGDILLTPDFIMSRQTGAAVKYSDMVWLYRRTIRSLLISASTNLVAYTADCRRYVLYRGAARGRGEEISHIMSVIGKCNQDMMIGYTGANAATYTAYRRTHRAVH